MPVILRTFLPGIIAVFLKAVNTTSQQSVLLVFLLDKFKHNLDFICMKCYWKALLFIDKGYLLMITNVITKVMLTSTAIIENSLKFLSLRQGEVVMKTEHNFACLSSIMHRPASIKQP